jgi:hypothetical protein
VVDDESTLIAETVGIGVYVFVDPTLVGVEIVKQEVADFGEESATVQDW